jgi:hypothetical protein
VVAAATQQQSGQVKRTHTGESTHEEPLAQGPPAQRITGQPIQTTLHDDGLWSEHTAHTVECRRKHTLVLRIAQTFSQWDIQIRRR